MIRPRKRKTLSQDDGRKMGTVLDPLYMFYKSTRSMARQKKITLKVSLISSVLYQVGAIGADALLGFAEARKSENEESNCIWMALRYLLIGWGWAWRRRYSHMKLIIATIGWGYL
jgi:hypothetical protein